MSRSPDWMPQFNWPVFGPFLGILATLLVVGAVVGVRLWPGGDNVAGTPILSVDGTNPDRDAPLPENPGVGGPALQPPGARDARIRSLPARVSGTPGVRAGPGTQYPGLHQLKDGDEVHVIACSPGCEWLRLFSATDPQAQHWVPAVFLTVAGRVETLPVLTPQ
jgi:hypothetical protein